MSKVSGIYLITCKPEGGLPYYYVGQSSNIGRRAKTHFQSLNKGRHHNRFVQRCFNKHGYESFSFEILETCAEHELDDREGWWLSEMVGFKRCLNLSRDAIAPFRGKQLSDEHRLAISRGGKGKKRDESTRKAISVANSGEKNSMFGKAGKLNARSVPVIGKSIETSKIIRFESMQIAEQSGFAQESISRCCNGKSKSHLGYRWMIDCGDPDPFPEFFPRKRKVVEVKPRQKYEASEETKKKISESKKGEKNHFFGKSGKLSPVAKRVQGISIKDGSVIIFESVAESRRLGFTPGKISTACCGENKVYNGYTWEHCD